MLYRPALLSKLQLQTQVGAEKDRGQAEKRTRESLIEILELGALSYLRSLQEEGGETAGLRDRQPLDSCDLESEEQNDIELEDHWMKEGEREKERERIAAEILRTQDLKLTALSSSRAQIMHLVQQLPHLNVPLSDSFGSQLISAFLLSGDVDSALAILNILLRSGGHASDLACESLARRLLSDGRQAMARAICRLMHSRGRLCDHSFYSFLFASILAPAAVVVQVSSTSSILQKPPVRESIRDIGLWESLKTDGTGGSTDDVEDSAVEGMNEAPAGGISAGPGGAVDMSAAVTEALLLLGEIFSASTSTTANAISAASTGNSNGTGQGLSDSSLIIPSSVEQRFRKISNNLIEILIRLGYTGIHLETVHSAILNISKKNRIA